MSSTSDNNINEEQVSALRQLLKTLNIKREALEHESDAIILELTTRDPEQPDIPPMGIDTPLIDNEGYPRNDIDVYKARSLRNRLNTIRTDHTVLMNEINTSLQQLAILQKIQSSSSSSVEYKEQIAKEEELRSLDKPKPKFDPISGKWVVKNWDGTIAGIPSTTSTNERFFDDIGVVVDELSSSKHEIPIFKGAVVNIHNNNNMEVVSSSDDDTDKNTNQNDVIDMNDHATSTSKPLPSSTQKMIYRSAISITDCRINNNNNHIHHLPFARVDSVTDHSPAYIAGLKINDYIIAFGPIIKQWDTTMISELVTTAATNDEMIEVLCQREQKSSNSTDNGIIETIFVILQLSPHPWSGRGLLGCHIVPC